MDEDYDRIGYVHLPPWLYFTPVYTNTVSTKYITYDILLCMITMLCTTEGWY